MEQESNPAENQGFAPSYNSDQAITCFIIGGGCIQFPLTVICALK